MLRDSWRCAYDFGVAEFPSGRIEAGDILVFVGDVEQYLWKDFDAAVQWSTAVDPHHGWREYRFTYYIDV